MTVALTSHTAIVGDPSRLVMPDGSTVQLSAVSTASQARRIATWLSAWAVQSARTEAEVLGHATSTWRGVTNAARTRVPTLDELWQTFGAPSSRSRNDGIVTGIAAAIGRRAELGFLYIMLAGLYEGAGLRVTDLPTGVEAALFTGAKARQQWTSTSDWRAHGVEVVRRAADDYGQMRSPQAQRLLYERLQTLGERLGRADAESMRNPLVVLAVVVGVTVLAGAVTAVVAPVTVSALTYWLFGESAVAAEQARLLRRQLVEANEACEQLTDPDQRAACLRGNVAPIADKFDEIRESVGPGAASGVQRTLSTLTLVAGVAAIGFVWVYARGAARRIERRLR